MRNLFLSLAAVILAAAPVMAQSDHPVAEVFGGYSYLSTDVSFNNPFETGGFFDQREGFHGGAVSVAGNFTRSLGVVADLSYHRKSLELPFTENVSDSRFVFLFGPQLTLRSRRVNAFGHVLVGGLRSKLENFGSSTDFALGAGGGIDINATRTIGIRAVQVDYIPTRTGDIFTGGDTWAHNMRVQGGVVFRFGGR